MRQNFTNADLPGESAPFCAPPARIKNSDALISDRLDNSAILINSAGASAPDTNYPSRAKPKQCHEAPQADARTGVGESPFFRLRDSARKSGDVRRMCHPTKSHGNISDRNFSRPFLAPGQRKKEAEPPHRSRLLTASFR